MNAKASGRLENVLTAVIEDHLAENKVCMIGVQAALVGVEAKVIDTLIEASGLGEETALALHADLLRELLRLRRRNGSAEYRVH